MLIICSCAGSEINFNKKKKTPAFTLKALSSDFLLDLIFFSVAVYAFISTGTWGPWM